MEILITFNVFMERYLITAVIILNHFSSLKDYHFFPNKYGDITKDSTPICNCEEKGRVRPNILLYNDSEWNTERSDQQEI